MFPGYISVDKVYRYFGHVFEDGTCYRRLLTNFSQGIPITRKPQIRPAAPDRYPRANQEEYRGKRHHRYFQC